MLSGFAIRQKLAGNGGRQIFALTMTGDLADLPNALLGTADHNLQALTHVEAAMIPVEAILNVAFARPAVGRAMWSETLVDASISREWALNVGRRDARTRTAHMLCEFSLRLEMAKLGERCSYEIPMSQEQLGDALGLTSVHVNRVFRQLRDDGLIRTTGRRIEIGDFDALAAIGDFDSTYLHIAQDSDPARRR
jgi:CRP-like cAMP-binding protein